MACPLPIDQINNLKLFINLCKQDPSVLYISELGFFKSYIESLGGVIPAKKAKTDEKDEEPKAPEAEPVVEETESAESDVELDFEGVIEPDNDPPEIMGSSDKEVSEEDMEKSNEKKREAIDLYAQGKYEEAIKMYTEAILLNPRAALLYAKRGQCFLLLKKPNACVRDCSQALEINPDNAAAYKFRGRAHRLLGNFVKAAEDLRMACKIDFDEEADEWLREVTPNARKLEEHQRKYERKKLEKELKETRERIKEMKKEPQATESEAEDNGWNFANYDMSDFQELLDFVRTNPELLSAFQDPKVMEAFMKAGKNPEELNKYKDHPIMQKIWDKLPAKFKTEGITSLLEKAKKAKQATEPPKTASDVDLD